MTGQACRRAGLTAYRSAYICSPERRRGAKACCSSESSQSTPSLDECPTSLVRPECQTTEAEAVPQTPHEESPQAALQGPDLTITRDDEERRVPPSADLDISPEVSQTWTVPATRGIQALPQRDDDHATAQVVSDEGSVYAPAESHSSACKAEERSCEYFHGA